MSVCVCSFLTVFGSLAIGGAIGMVFESASTANSSEDSNNNPGVGEEKICGVFAEILNNNQDFLEIITNLALRKQIAYTKEFSTKKLGLLLFS